MTSPTIFNGSEIIIMTQTTRLTNLQLELLRLFSREIHHNELLEIKRMIADYFSKKLTTEAEKIWDEKRMTDDDMDQWLRELS